MIFVESTTKRSSPKPSKKISTLVAKKKTPLVGAALQFILEDVE
jgi:hypothetical protein